MKEVNFKNIINKNMKKIFLFTLMAILTAGFAACSDSDDENNNGGTTPETKHELTEAQML